MAERHSPSYSGSPASCAFALSTLVITTGLGGNIWMSARAGEILPLS
jgi:adenosylmethionine-8-amino-7-oxononanoate aminotransferase